MRLNIASARRCGLNQASSARWNWWTSLGERNIYVPGPGQWPCRAMRKEPTDGHDCGAYYAEMLAPPSVTGCGWPTPTCGRGRGRPRCVWQLWRRGEARQQTIRDGKPSRNAINAQGAVDTVTPTHSSWTTSIVKADRSGARSGTHKDNSTTFLSR
jgi:hypothetical protein